MKPRHRWFQYSLRSFLVLLTALAVWLGIVVNRAREQREAVKAIEALGGAVAYDWQQDIPPGTFPFYSPVASQPPGPAWLRRIVGDDFFQNASQVNFGGPMNPIEIELSKAIPCLKQLRTLKQVRVFAVGDFDRQKDLKAALPRCDFQLYYLDNSRYSIPIRMLNR